MISYVLLTLPLLGRRPSSSVPMGAGSEAAVATVCATVGAIGGAFTCEMIGGDLAASQIGSFASLFCRGAGRSLGRIVGGTLGAALRRAGRGLVADACARREPPF